MTPATSTGTRAAATRAAILAAATDEFAAFGLRRASMEGVARRAGIARATLYLHWRSKDDLFRDLVTALHETHLQEMAEALERPGTVQARLVAAFDARFGRWVELTAQSAHAAELYDLHGRLCGDIARDSQARSEKLLARMLRAAQSRGEIDLGRSGLSAPRAAAALFDCAHGAKGEDPSTATPAEFRVRLERMVALVCAGLCT